MSPDPNDIIAETQRRMGGHTGHAGRRCDRGGGGPRGVATVFYLVWVINKRLPS
jgi:hypothetical protein